MRNHKMRSAYLNAAADYIAEVMADLNTDARRRPRCGVRVRADIDERRAFAMLKSAKNRIDRIAASDVCGGDEQHPDADPEGIIDIDR